MGTLTSELASHAGRSADAPRVYADANLPVGLVAFMRARLGWDVFFVMEHDDLRRASDERHYALAREMHRTLLSLDHDYTDDRRFPPSESPGVIVFSAPDERWLRKLLKQANETVFRSPNAAPLPLEGRKVLWNIDGHS